MQPSGCRKVAIRALVSLESCVESRWVSGRDRLAPQPFPRKTAHMGVGIAIERRCPCAASPQRRDIEHAQELVFRLVPDQADIERPIQLVAKRLRVKRIRVVPSSRSSRTSPN